MIIFESLLTTLYSTKIFGDSRGSSENRFELEKLPPLPS
jgi:hypothetical protein